MRRLFILFLLMLMIAPVSAETYDYAISGALVTDDLACYGDEVTITYRLRADSDTTGPRLYRIPGIDSYPTISVLSTTPGDVSLIGDVVTWQAHTANDAIVLIGGGLLVSECPTAIGVVSALGQTWLPLVLR